MHKTQIKVGVKVKITRVPDFAGNSVWVGDSAIIARGDDGEVTDTINGVTLVTLYINGRYWWWDLEGIEIDPHPVHQIRGVPVDLGLDVNLLIHWVKELVKATNAMDQQALQIAFGNLALIEKKLT